MRRKRLIRVAGALLGLALVGLLAWGIWRVYGPGSAAERWAAAKTRWKPFYGPDSGAIWWFIFQGLLLTLQAAAISIVLSLFFGMVLALMRLARRPILRTPGGPLLRLGMAVPATVVVQAIRSSPLFMLILYMFIAVPKLGLNMSPLVAGITALTLYTSCVLAEIGRAGILSLERGQFEAAASLGLGYFRTLRWVILPQALRRMIPAVVSQLVTLLKDTSLLNFITVIELSRRLYILQQRDFNPIECFLVAAACYFVLNFALSALARRLEVGAPRQGPKPQVQAVGGEDQTRFVTDVPQKK